MLPAPPPRQPRKNVRRSNGIDRRLAFLPGSPRLGVRHAPAAIDGGFIRGGRSHQRSHFCDAPTPSIEGGSKYRRWTSRTVR